MKVALNSRLRASTRTGVASWCARLVIVAAVVLQLTATTPAQTTSPTVDGRWPPDDAPARLDVGLDPTIDFSHYAWRTLLGCIWPADPLHKGEPDPSKSLADNLPVTLDAWANVEELYQPDGTRPRPWSDAGPRLPPGVSGALPSRLLTQVNQMGFDAPTGPLIAQNGTFTWYETRINRRLYEHLRGADDRPTSWLYRAANLPGRDAAPLDYPVGSLCVKLAWREFKLPAERALTSRYHVREAYVKDPVTQAWQLRTLGLVGLHVIARTEKRPEWLWFSFEHNDNLVIAPGAPAGLKPCFNDPSGPQSKSDPSVNKLPAKIDPLAPPSMVPAPVQVVRVSRLDDQIQATNHAYQTHVDVRDSVWKHYSLIVAQWPTIRATRRAYPDSAGKPFPDAANFADHPIANSVMETLTIYQQSESCMKCHSAPQPLATGRLWFVTRRALPAPDTLERVAPVRARRDTLRERTGRTAWPTDSGIRSAGVPVAFLRPRRIRAAKGRTAWRRLDATSSIPPMPAASIRSSRTYITRIRARFGNR